MRRGQSSRASGDLHAKTVPVSQTIWQQLGSGMADRMKFIPEIEVRIQGNHGSDAGTAPFLVIAGSAHDPYPIFGAGSVLGAYRIFLAVCDLIPAGKMDANARMYLVASITEVKPNSTAVSWASRALGLKRWREIRATPPEDLPKPLAALRQRRMGRSR